MSSDEEVSPNKTEAFWRVYNTLKSPSSIIGIYSEIVKPISKTSGLRKLITEAASVLRLDFSDAFDYFDFDSNPNDPRDTLNHSDISLVSFTRRLGNYVLEKIYLEGDFDKTLREFISEVRGEPDEVKQKESPEIKRKNTVNESSSSKNSLSRKGTLNKSQIKGSDSFRANEDSSRVSRKNDKESGDEDYKRKPTLKSEKGSDQNTSKISSKSGKKGIESVNKSKAFDNKIEEEDKRSDEETDKSRSSNKKQSMGGLSNFDSRFINRSAKDNSGSNEVSNSKLNHAFNENDSNDSDKEEEDRSKASEFFKIGDNFSPTSSFSKKKVEKSESSDENREKSPQNISKATNKSKLSQKFSKIKEASDSDISAKRSKKLSVSSRSNKSSKKSSSRSKQSREKNDSSSEENDQASGLFGLGLSKQAIKEVREEKNRKQSNSSSSKSSDSSKKQSILDSVHSKLLNPSKANAKLSKTQWFTHIIKGKEVRIKEIFMGFNTNKGSVTVKELPDLFIAVTSEINVLIHDHHKETFKGIYETLHPVKTIQQPKKKTHIIYPRLKFEDFIEIMNLWGVKYLEEQESVAGELIKTIKLYKELNVRYSDLKVLNPLLYDLSKSLEKSLRHHTETHKEELSIKEKHKKYLEDIFQFYAKMQRIQGTEDTFEAMEASNTNWNLGKFLKFCADFNIVLGKAEEKRALTKEQLTSIFKRTANNTRLMSEAQFIESLDKIAEIIYSPDLDKLLSTNLAYIPIPEKRILLYKLLGITNFKVYHKKKKAFGIAFSPEKFSRIPLSEPSNRYKFKLNENSQKKLEIWKKTKVARETPPLLKPIPEVKNSYSFVKKSAKALPIAGYALRLKAKRNQLNSKEAARSDSYDEPEVNSRVREEERKEEGVESQQRFITIQALNNLNYKDLDDEYGIKDLISDEADEFFDKLYGVEPKLQGIMKMHDEKLLRGQKVLERNKYAHKNNN